MFVLDASAILSWCFDDERPENADALMRRLVDGGMIAPSHWPLEVANVLWVGERAKRLTPQQATGFIALIDALRIEIDLETPRRAWSEIREIAKREQLSIYDSAYLELAIRRQATLVSKDKPLLKAARKNMVPVLELVTANA